MIDLVLKLGNILNEIIKICREPAYNMAVLDMQTRILKIIDKGLNKQKIKRSECPCGGINCAWGTEDCE